MMFDIEEVILEFYVVIYIFKNFYYITSTFSNRIASKELLALYNFGGYFVALIIASYFQACFNDFRFFFLLF